VFIKKLLGKRFNSDIPILEGGIMAATDRQKDQVFLKQFSNQFHHNHDGSFMPNFQARTQSILDTVVLSEESVRKLLSEPDPSKQGGRTASQIQF
jgi:hypothetical protein